VITEEAFTEFGRLILRERHLKKMLVVALKFGTESEQAFARNEHEEAQQEFRDARNRIYRAAVAAAQQEEKNAELN
jgi:hypothetical protein